MHSQMIYQLIRQLILPNLSSSVNSWKELLYICIVCILWLLLPSKYDSNSNEAVLLLLLFVFCVKSLVRSDHLEFFEFTLELLYFLVILTCGFLTRCGRLLSHDFTCILSGLFISWSYEWFKKLLSTRIRDLDEDDLLDVMSKFSYHSGDFRGVTTRI